MKMYASLKKDIQLHVRGFNLGCEVEISFVARPKTDGKIYNDEIEVNAIDYGRLYLENEFGTEFIDITICVPARIQADFEKQVDKIAEQLVDTERFNWMEE